MEFTPGKYRMANGEQAIVVCDVGENPIGRFDDCPLKGFTKNGGMAWTRNGMPCVGYTVAVSLKEPWTDPPTTLEVCEELAKRGHDLTPDSFKRPETFDWVMSLVSRAKPAIAAEKARTA